MKLSVKIAIGCSIVAASIMIFGFIIFPKMVADKVKGMVNLGKDSDLRKLIVKIPFPIELEVYMFNVTNPRQVQNGASPVLQEVGPFCFDEWQEKVDVEDIDEEDVMFYKPKETFYKASRPGCLSGDEIITIPHPLILSMVNTVARTRPAMLSLVNKAIDAIFNKTDSIFLRTKVMDILFDGVTVHCGVKEFAGKAVCDQLKETPDLRRLSNDDLAFSIMSPKNGTVGKKFKVLRGLKDSRDVGRILEYDDKKAMDIWPTEECNKFKGTDGTILPPFLTKEEGIVSFAPDMCRSLTAVYVEDDNYDGIPVRRYTADLGDMSKNADEKCYCPTSDTCLKKGMMDLFKCIGVPIYVSFPHFYNSDESYLKGVQGLNPNKERHGVAIYFEHITGAPLKAEQRLQFNMPVEPNDKIPIFNKLPDTVLPLFWVQEKIALNDTFTAPVKNLFRAMEAVNIVKWTVLFACLCGLAAAGYLHFVKKGQANITKVQKVKPVQTNGASTVSTGGQVNHAMSVDEVDKY